VSKKDKRRRRPSGEAAKTRTESAAQALSRLAAQAEEELRAAQERYRAARDAEGAALPEEERDFRWLYPPDLWHHGEEVWSYHGLPGQGP
jgi:hypothetical protein